MSGMKRRVGLKIGQNLKIDSRETADMWEKGIKNPGKTAT